MGQISLKQRVSVDGTQDRQQLHAAPPAFSRDGQTDGKTAGDLPIGMTTPNTATVRFSPRRKCSLPAEERERERRDSVREDE